MHFRVQNESFLNQGIAEGRPPRPLLAADRSSIDREACSDRERAIIDFALKLTKTPSHVTEQDVAALRSAPVALGGSSIGLFWPEKQPQ